MAEKKSKIGDISLDGSKQMAHLDTLKIKRLGIKSPNVSRMHRVTYGNTTYFFNTKRKMERFVKNETHYKLINLSLTDDEKHKPTIEEKFQNINQNTQENEKHRPDPDSQLQDREENLD